LIDRQEIIKILQRYNKDKIAIGALASHSALDIADGAKDENFESYLWCQKGREKTYTTYFKSVWHNGKHVKGVVDHPIVLDKFKEMVSQKWQDFMIKNNILIIPNRSMVAYCGADALENDFYVPLVGSRNLLKLENRGDVTRDYYWLIEETDVDKSILRTPDKIKPENIQDIDSLVIIKLHHAKHKLERGFFTAGTFDELKEKAQRLIKRGVIEPCHSCGGKGCEKCYYTGIENFEHARIERYAIGPVANFDFFYSPVSKEIGEEPLELLGIDARYESSLDGYVRLPARQQITLPESQEEPTYIIVGHSDMTLRESLLEHVFKMGEEFIRITQKYFDPGIIGPFTIQTTIEDDMKPTVYDISVRIGGGTNVHMFRGAPYGNIIWRSRMSTGRRIALEIRRAIDNGMLELIVT